MSYLSTIFARRFSLGTCSNKASGLYMQGLRERTFIMISHKILPWVVVASALISVAAAQNSQLPSFPAKSGPDAMNPAMKPLTPKSAMPTHRKSSIGVPNVSKSGSSTNAELSRLERTEHQARPPPIEVVAEL